MSSRDLLEKMLAEMEPEIREIMQRLGLDLDDPGVQAEFTAMADGDFNTFNQRLDEFLRRKRGTAMLHPRPQFVFVVEAIRGRWYPVLELHRDCKPGHLGCKVIDRSFPFGGFDTREIAEGKLKAWVDEHIPGARWFSRN